MTRKKIRVHSKGKYHWRKDLGAKGHGKKVVPPLKKGKLTSLGYGVRKSAAVRHKAIRKAIGKYGCRKVRGMLGVQRVFRKQPIYGKGGKTQARTFNQDYNYAVKVCKRKEKT